MKNKLIVFTATIIVVLVGVFFYDKYRVAPKIKFDSLALTDLDGNRVNLDTFSDKKLFINFFATWCGPCLREFPSMINAQSILGKENFHFIIISEEPILRLQSFREQTDIPLLILHSEKSLSKYRIFTLPTSYVLNAKKEIAFTKVGVVEWDSNDMIEKLRAISN